MVPFIPGLRKPPVFLVRGFLVIKKWGGKLIAAPEKSLLALSGSKTKRVPTPLFAPIEGFGDLGEHESHLKKKRENHPRHDQKIKSAHMPIPYIL
jgi:hypothetical protein